MKWSTRCGCACGTVVETQVAQLIEAAFARLPGLVTTEAGVDYGLATIVDDVVARGGRDHALLDVTDDNCGAMRLLIARNAAAQVGTGSCGDRREAELAVGAALAWPRPAPDHPAGGLGELRLLDRLGEMAGEPVRPRADVVGF